MSNFEQICCKKFNGINNDIYMYRHKSGLCLYYYANMTSNSFNIATKIKNNDTSEVFHILEHMICKGNKNIEISDLSSFIKDNFDAKFRATTDFNHINFYIENNILNEYFGLVDLLLNNVFNPSLLKEDFLIEGIHKEKNDGKVVYTGRVYNEVVNKKNRDIDAYRNYMISCIKNDSSKKIIDVTYDDVLDAYNEYFKPSNMIIICAGNFKVEYLLDIIDKYISNYNMVNNTNDCNESNENKIMNANQNNVITKEFNNIKESAFNDLSLMYLINDGSCEDLMALNLIFDYINEYAIEYLKNELVDKEMVSNISTQCICNIKGYNFFNIRAFDVKEDNIDAVFSDLEGTLKNLDVDFDLLRKIFISKLIDIDKNYNNNLKITKELNKYLIMQQYDFIDYDENVLDNILEHINNEDLDYFNDKLIRYLSSKNIYKFIFKNKLVDSNDEISYLDKDQNDIKLINNYLKGKEISNLSKLDEIITNVKNRKVYQDTYLNIDANKYVNKYNEVKIKLKNNNDTNLTYQKEYLIHLLGLNIKALLDNKLLSSDKIYDVNVESKDNRLIINLVTSNDLDCDISKTVIDLIRISDLNEYFYITIVKENEIINGIKTKSNKTDFVLRTVSNMALKDKFNPGALCHLENEELINDIRKMDFNILKDYLLDNKEFPYGDIKKKDYKKVLLLSNRRNITAMCLNIKDLEFNDKHNEAVVKKTKEYIDKEIKKKKGSYASYIQCDLNLFIVAIIGDNDYKYTLNKFDEMKELYAYSCEPTLKRLGKHLMDRQSDIKLCLCLNKNETNYNRNDYDLVYEFND